MAETRTPTGLLVIRAWREPGSAAPLRIEVRRSLDVNRGLNSAHRTTHPDEACTVVRHWLEAMLVPPQEEGLQVLGSLRTEPLVAARAARRPPASTKAATVIRAARPPRAR